MPGTERSNWYEDQNPQIPGPGSSSQPKCLLPGELTSLRSFSPPLSFLTAPPCCVKVYIPELGLLLGQHCLFGPEGTFNSDLEGTWGTLPGGGDTK